MSMPLSERGHTWMSPKRSPHSWSMRCLVERPSPLAQITGIGPTDTRYVNPSDAPKTPDR